MTSLESLYYAMGQLAYAIAKVDGQVQVQEREKFHQMLAAELQRNEHEVDVSDIIFRILEKQRLDSRTAYNWAIRQIKLHSHYMSPNLKEKFVRVMDMVAQSFKPITPEEQNLIKRFKEDVGMLKGDPVFFE